MMYRKSARFVILLVLVLYFHRLTFAQAHVDESQESAKLYVDAAHGSDSNPGTQLKPLRTIGKAATLAVSNNHAGIGTKIIINSGTYRESIALYGGGKDTPAPITFEAASPTKAVLSGADVWSNWQVSPGDSRVYTHGWPYNWGLCPPEAGDAPAEPDIVRRREMVFVNGTPMTQVLTRTAMRVGTFYVSEGGGTVYVFPPAGTDMNTAKVEVSTRETLFDLARKANVVFRGLTFQDARSCRGGSALYVRNSENVLLDHNYFFWNNAAGLMLRNVADLTVQGSVAKHNGTSGLKSRRTKNALWQNDTAYYNGWRGAQGVYYKWSESGFHFMLAHNQSVHNLDSSWNETHAFHWDTDMVNVAADTITAAQNLLAGTVIERVQGPLSISNAVYCNGNPVMGPNTIGFHLRNSKNVTVSDSQIRGNRNGLNISGDPGGIMIQNWETGEYLNVINKNFIFNNNTIYAGADQQTVNDGVLGGPDWRTFRDSLKSDYNTWWNDQDAKSFLVPTPDPWTRTDFPGWKQASNADVHSVWQQPGGSGVCTAQPGSHDFWLVMDFQGGWQTISQGGQAIFTSYVVPIAFSGTVNLYSDGVQNIPGASGKWTPNQIVSSGTADFTVTTSNSTPKGTYPITLTAVSGNVTRAMTVMVVID